MNRSLKALSIFADTASHDDFSGLNLHIIFPEVQVILLRHFSLKCTSCEYALSELEDLENGKLDPEKIDNCMSLARKSFKGFTKLRRMCANLGPSPLVRNFKEAEFDLETL